MHIVIDWSVELGGLPDTSDVRLLGYNVGEHVVVGLVVDLMLHSLAAEALVLAGRETAFSVDLVADMQKYVVDSQPVIVIDVGFVVQPVDVHTPYQQLDMDQLVHWLVFPILNHQDLLIHHVDHPSSTYCLRAIGMMDIVAVVVVTDVGLDDEHTRLVVPSVLVRLHHIGSMHHCKI